MERTNSYKKTEVGVIPEDWEVRQVGDILKVKHGKSQHQVVDENGQYPILATGGEIGRANQYLFDKPSVLIGRKGTIDRPQYIETPFWSIDTLFYTEISRKAIAKYIYYLFDRIDWYSYNEASGVPSLNASTIEKINIPLPPLQEQKAIAKVLSDVDELITSIEELIDKKQKIKQGMMQLLLTGKKRLPGFTGEWERVKIKDLLYYERPEKYIESEIDESKYGLIPVLTANKAFILGTTNNKLNCYTDLPVIIFDDFTVESKYVDFVFKVRSSAIKILKPRRNVDVKFVYYLMQIISFSVGDHKRHYISQYQEINVTVPSFPEQKAIAQILSDMDLEIEALEEKLNKYKLIKDGMMEQLLTGKVRLI